MAKFKKGDKILYTPSGFFSGSKPCIGHIVAVHKPQKQYTHPIMRQQYSVRFENNQQVSYLPESDDIQKIGEDDTIIRYSGISYTPDC